MNCALHRSHKRLRALLAPAFLLALAALPGLGPAARAEELVSNLGQQPDDPTGGLRVPRSRLTPEELHLAIRIATTGSAQPGSRPSGDAAGGKTVVSGVEMALGDKDDPESVLAIVVTYNYERHETSRRTVDLKQKRIVREDILGDASAPLATVEKDEARRLVLANARVRELLGSHLAAVEVGFLQPTLEDAGHPYFGKRIAHALFTAGSDYLGLPAVLVNLTDGEVLVEERRPGAEP